MHRADARAGQHCVSRLGNHRQVDGDSVATADAMRLQDIGELADLRVQVAIGDVPGFLRVIAFPDDRRLVAARRQMTVNAIIGHVGEAVLEPFDRDIVWIEAGVLDLRVRLEPVDALALLAPEGVRMSDGLRIHGLVFCIVHEGAARPFIGDGVNFLGHVSLPGKAVSRPFGDATFAQDLCAALCRCQGREQAFASSHFGWETLGEEGVGGALGRDQGHSFCKRSRASPRPVSE